jgi:RimJ/RimL family protein N-acetyltransferase
MPLWTFMTSRYWPPFDLRLTHGALTLRPVTEADLDALCVATPPDVEADPSLPALPGLDPGAARAAGICQFYWRSQATWSPDNWRLGFLASLDGRVVGFQELEGVDFTALGTVDTSSWVVADRRGEGIGAAMRLAVLALAFDGLGATAAVSSAWHDNAASLRVSTKLGYVDNGVRRHRRGGGVDDMVHVRLAREVWQHRHAGRHSVTIADLEPCLPWFGAPAGPV